jgi:hypothetical protein
MKFARQNGQAMAEYLIALAGVLIAALASLRLLHDALNGQWDTLSFWLILPNP